MTPKQVSLVRQTWQQLEPLKNQLPETFYQQLFALDSTLERLFNTSPEEHHKRFIAMFDAAINGLEHLDQLKTTLSALGERHVAYGVQPAHYQVVGQALINTLQIMLGKDFTASVKRAWLSVYKVISETMISAANEVTAQVNTEQSEQLEEQQVQGIEMDMTEHELAVRLQGALDQSTTAFMMIDRDLVINYANQATIDLLKRIEDVMRIRWPDFEAKKDKLLGSCIDIFHKNPEHQRALLADPNNLPYKTDIRLEHLFIELNVTAILDTNGQYIGNCLEWQDVTEVRLKSLEVGRLTSAVNGMTTNLMMADLQGNIVYANPAVKNMLRHREAQLQQVLPSFSVDTMVGSNFDDFHQNPAHQQSLLGDPKNLPYTSQISVVGLTFELTAIPLFDENSQHIGNAVQWRDMTEEKDAQLQIEKLISDAIAGNLESRIDTSAYRGFMKDLGNSINELMDSIIEPVTEVIKIAKALSAGDLTNTMQGDYRGEFLALANAMNESIANLSSMVNDIRLASTNVFEAAAEIASGNSELSNRTESQASSLEETASAMEELASTVQQNAENTTAATKLSESVKESAANGGEVVKNAVTAMSDINKSSKKIADIISVIDEIAFQTNLLALNAAVEAARAGEQGRGFAVVAAEVRNLAQRSAAAAKEIKCLINDSVDAVNFGTKLVDKTGQTFAELISAVENVSNMISDIDSAGKEQSAGINEVSAAVSQMDEMTQQNAALVEQAAASSRAMAEQSQALLEQMRFFTVDLQYVDVTESQKSNEAAHENQPIVRSIARPETASDQEWEEF